MSLACTISIIPMSSHQASQGCMNAHWCKREMQIFRLVIYLHNMGAGREKHLIDESSRKLCCLYRRSLFSPGWEAFNPNMAAAGGTISQTFSMQPHKNVINIIPVLIDRREHALKGMYTDHQWGSNNIPHLYAQCFSTAFCTQLNFSFHEWNLLYIFFSPFLCCSLLCYHV